VKFLLIAAGSLALAGAALLESSWGKIERAAELDIATSLGVSRVDVRVVAVADGLLGSALGRVSSVEIAASGFAVDGNPFFCDPALSKAGKLGMLRLRLRDFVVHDLPVDLLEADIPGCRFALGMLTKGKVRLSRSGEGPGSVTIAAEHLRQYMLSRFKVFESLQVRLEKYKLFATGRAAFGPIRREFEIICDLEISGKRALVIENPIVFVEGLRVRDGSEDSLVRAFNPVLDIDKDLGMAGAFDMQKIVVRGGKAVITGTARIPVLQE
jgi:hypothetical protein